MAMARKIIHVIRERRDDPMMDILGGTWLVTLLFGMLHLPSLFV
jgi:hypothetical protein